MVAMIKDCYRVVDLLSCLQFSELATSGLK